MTQRAVSFPTAAYLARIGDPSFDLRNPEAAIRTIALAQHATIPFENLDVHRGEEINVDPADVIDRVIHRRRGGLCYQLNGVLALALRSLGISVAQWGARVTTGGTTGPDGGHMAPVVQLAPDRNLLVDVGFGGNAAIYPIDPAVDADLAVRFAASSYVLDPADRDLADFAEAARWHSTSPESRITGSVLCTLPGPGGGRRTLAGRIGPDHTVGYRLIDDDGTDRRERPLTAAQSDAELAEVFGMPSTRAPRTSVHAPASHAAADRSKFQGVANGSPR